MNYKTVRIVLILIILVLQFLLLKVIKKSDKNNIIYIKVKLRTIIIILLVIFIAIWTIPFENLFIKYKTIEDNINYFLPNYKIQKTFVYDDSAYVLLTNKNDYILTYLNKNNGSWKINNLITKDQGKIFHIDDKIFSIINKKSTEKIAIGILFVSFNNKEVVIKDSINSEIYIYSKNQKNTKLKDNLGIIILDKSVNKKDYSIYIDNKEYKPFK